MSSPFPQPAPDFSDPLGLLRACHGRIEQHSQLLLQLAQQLQQQGCSAELSQAADKVYRYFSTAVRHHHEDEERDLFPRLTQLAAEQLNTLRQQHQQLDAQWAAVATLLRHPATIEDRAEFVRLGEALASAYREHIALEEAEILPLAEQILDRDQLKALGQAMATRRGVPL